MMWGHTPFGRDAYGNYPKEGEVMDAEVHPFGLAGLITKPDCTCHDESKEFNKALCPKHGMKAQADQAAAEALALSYAKDIVAMWPNISFRTLRTLNEKVQGLKEALELLGK